MQNLFKVLTLRHADTILLYVACRAKLSASNLVPGCALG